MATTTTPQTKPVAKPDLSGKKPPEPKDSFREIVETLVFVVALVLLLKLFSVEAFVIPTGSMAETLFGYHKVVTCRDCGYEYVVNSSEEEEPSDDQKHELSGACCPNCRNRVSPDEWAGARRLPNRSGDRVLVHKAIYGFSEPARGDVVVFKFPVDPQSRFTSQNYIKRLWGLGEETIVLHRGDLYSTRKITYPPDVRDSFGTPKYARPEPDQMNRIWEGPEVSSCTRTNPPYISLGIDFTYHNADVALNAFAADRERGFVGGDFELLRKTESQAMAMRRIVNDNNYQSAYLASKGVPLRWAGEGWNAPKTANTKVFSHTASTPHRLTYSHRISAPLTELPLNPETVVLVDDRKKVDLGYQDGLFPAAPILNFLGYNSGEEKGHPRRSNNEYWVSDLMLETSVQLSAGASVTLELSKGTRRFQAKFTEGQLTLSTVGPGAAEIATVPTSIKAGRAYDLRFADFDSQLRVWVNGSMLTLPDTTKLAPWDATGFDKAVGAALGAVFTPARDGCTVQNDIASPAAIVAQGEVEVKDLRLWQDTYFTPGSSYGYADPLDPIDSYYVQPGHFLCLGDNSGQSQDGRKWGLVPERLMLGKAMFVFWKGQRIGFIK